MWSGSTNFWDGGHTVALLIEAICYKPEGRWFDSRWGNRFFNWLHPSSCTMALGSAQPLTEMSTSNLLGGKGRSSRNADNLTAIFEPTVLRKCGRLDILQPYGLPWPVTGIALPLPLSPRKLRHVILYMFTNVLEEYTASVFRFQR
jgi:hypothetical protein